MIAPLTARYAQVWRNLRVQGNSYEEAWPLFIEEVESDWTQAYKRLCAARSTKLVKVKHDFTYVFDVCRPSPAHDERVVVMHGESARPTQKRDKNYMRKFPLPKSQLPFVADRGHLGSHAQGGNESGINLVPMARQLNQGISPQGKEFQAMERYCAANPGTFFWVRLLYTATTWTPQQLEYGIIPRTGALQVKLFDNA